MRHALIVLLLLVTTLCFGQLSQGGYPMELPSYKSAQLSGKSIRMPEFKMEEEQQLQKIDNYKSIKFAHSFKVSLTPENSGTWYENDGFRIWQETIESDGAYSLNIIFTRYYVPDGARLFVYDPEKKVILGAFTSDNNKPYKELAIYPLPGDRMIVQYEEPLNASFHGELEIGEINHDFKGVFSLNNRWKRRLSQSCNVDVNCEFDSGTEEQRRAVCRVIAGDELGTGTLLNNVRKDGKPYLISAFHVYDDAATAKVAIYDFNYESPYCTGLNGYDNQSVSGSVAVAAFDSTDLMLVRLSEMPPASYRPYLAGWDASVTPPFNLYIIHHPNGDTKKITHDTGTCDSMRYNNSFINYGHWKVLNWESGTTEGGSSGGALFNSAKRVQGTLSGGNASCDEITYDLFSRLDKQWNYRKDTSLQAKYWLDPDNTGTLQIDGYDPYRSTSKECTIVSGFMVEDSAVVLPVLKGKGWITGNNSDGITEVADKFTGYSKAALSGVSIGVSGYTLLNKSAEVTIRIYTGDTIPDLYVKQFKFPIKNLTEGAMNYLSFPETVEVTGTFFVSVVLPEGDSLQIYQSAMRPLVAGNSMLVLQDAKWKSINHYLGDQIQGASLLMQVVVCDASTAQSTDSVKYGNSFFRVYPNPASDYLVVEFEERAPAYDVWLYDMTGRMLISDRFENRMYGELSLTTLPPGIYLVRVSNNNTAETRRIVIK